MNRFLGAAIFMAGTLIANVTGAAAEGAGNPTLRLVGTAGNDTWDQFAIVENAIVVREAGATGALPRGVQWRFEGDLRAHGDAIYFAPECRIITQPAAPMRAAQRTRTHAIIFVRPTGPWTKAQLTGGVLVFCWLVDGRPVWVAPVVAETRTGPSSSFAAVAALELDATNLRGAPVVCLLRDGALVPPKPRFDRERANQVLAAMFLGPTDEFARLAATSNVSRQGGGSATLLHLAAEGGCTDAVRILLTSGAKPNERTWDDTPLHLAALNGRVECIDALLAARANRLATNQQNAVPLDVALARGHVDAARSLLGEKPSKERLMATLELAVRHHDERNIDFLNAALASRFGAKYKPAVVEALNPAVAGVRIYAASELTLPPAIKTAAKPEVMRQLRQDIQSVSTTELAGGVDRRGTSQVYEVTTTELRGPFDSEVLTHHWAVITLVVGPDGKPYQPRIVDGASRDISGEMLKAVEAYEFLPGELDGKPVATQMTLVVTIPSGG